MIASPTQFVDRIIILTRPLHVESAAPDQSPPAASSPPRKQNRSLPPTPECEMLPQADLPHPSQSSRIHLPSTAPPQPAGAAHRPENICGDLRKLCCEQLALATGADR